MYKQPKKRSKKTKNSKRSCIAKTTSTHSITSKRILLKQSIIPTFSSTTTTNLTQKRSFIIKPRCGVEYRKDAAAELRQTQIDWMKLRVRRPFYTGMTSNGLNYIDTRPTQSQNMGTIDGEVQYKPSPDNPHQNSLPKHTIATQNSPSSSSSTSKTSSTPTPSISTASTTSSPASSQSSSSKKSTTTSFHQISETLSPSTTSDQGITVIFSHGFSFGYGMWSENFDAISSLPGVNRVVAFDWRGMGGSLRHTDTGPMRSSASVFEEYKHDTFVMALKEEKMAENNLKTKDLKSKQCKKHFPNFFSNKANAHLVHPNNQGDQNGKNGPNCENAQNAHTTLDQSLPRHKSMKNNLIKSSIYQNDNSYTPQRAIDYFIDPLLQLFTELELTSQPIIVIGHSLGGYLSSNFVHKYPGLIQSLVLASPVGVSESYGLNHSFELELFQQYAISGVKREELLTEQIDSITNAIHSTLHPIDPLSSSLHNPSNASPHISSINHVHSPQKNPYFPTPTSMSLPTPTSTSTTTTTTATATTTSFSVSDTRLTRPLILRNPIIQLIDFLWKTNSTPQSLLRALPQRFSYQVSTSLAARMHPPGLLSPKDEEVLINYLHQIFTAPPVGEHALNSLLHIDYPSHRAKSEWKQYKSLIKMHYKSMSRPQDGQTNKSAHQNVQKDQKSDSNVKNDPNDQNLGKHPQSKSLFPHSTTSTETTSSFEASNAQQINSPYDSASDSEFEDDSPTSRTHSANDDQNSSKRGKKTKIPKRPVLPSVFARKPLSDIIYDINIPIHFLFGSHDWLFHRDVPYIIGSLHEHYKHPHVLDFLNNKIIQTAFPHGIDTTKEITAHQRISQSKVHKNDIAYENAENGHIKPKMVPFGENTIEKTENIDSTIDPTLVLVNQFNLRPEVTLTVLPQSGHHLYVNNVEAFHLSVQNSMVEYVNKSLLDNKMKYGVEFNPTYSTHALKHYHTQYQNFLTQDELDKENNRCNILQNNVSSDNNNTNHQSGQKNQIEVDNVDKSQKNTFEMFKQHAYYLFGQSSTLLFSQPPSVPLPLPQHHTQPLQFTSSQEAIIPASPIDSPLSQPQTPTHPSSPLQHAVNSSLLSQETTIPIGTLKNSVCKYAKFIYSTKSFRFQLPTTSLTPSTTLHTNTDSINTNTSVKFEYNGVSSTHFQQFHRVAEKSLTDTDISPINNLTTNPLDTYAGSTKL